MSDTIEYTLVLRSYIVTGTTLIALANVDVTYDVQRFFTRINSIHGVNLAKIEVAGILTIPGTQWEYNQGFEVQIDAGGLLNTCYSNYIDNGVQIMCVLANEYTRNYGALAADAGLFKIQSKAPVYISNLNSCTRIRLVMRDALSGQLCDDAPAYNIMLKVTPIFNT